MFFTQAPADPKTIGIDSGTQDLLKAEEDRSNRPIEQIMADETQGIDQGRALGQSNQSLMQQAQSMGLDPHMLQAIRDEYQNRADQGLGSLKATAGVQAKIGHGDTLDRLAKRKLAMWGARANQNKFLSQVYNANDTARAQFVNTLFQTFNYAYGVYKGGQKGETPQTSIQQPEFNLNQPQYNLQQPNFAGPQTPPTPQYNLGSDYKHGY